jgi:hypothetical protein
MFKCVRLMAGRSVSLSATQAGPYADRRLTRKQIKAMPVCPSIRASVCVLIRVIAKYGSKHLLGPSWMLN